MKKQPKIETLTKREITTYERLRNQVKKIRRKILRLERERNKTDVERRPNIPAMVLPKLGPTPLKIGQMKRLKIAYKKYREAMEMAIETTKEVRKGYMEAFRTILNDKFGTKFYIYKNGKRFNLNDPDEIKNARGLIFLDEDYKKEATGIEKKAYELYYRYMKLSNLEFNHMYQNGYIQQLKFLYTEFSGIDQGELSFVDEAQANLSEYRKKYILHRTPTTKNIRAPYKGGSNPQGNTYVKPRKTGK